MSDWIRGARVRRLLALPVMSWIGLQPAICPGQQVARAPGEFERTIVVPALQAPRSACAVLDGAAAAHTARGAQEMTLWADDRPVPFTVTINSPNEAGPAQAVIANYRMTGESTEFDLQMPAQKYSSISLELGPLRRALIFEATVTLPGSVTAIGRYSLFDLGPEAGPSQMNMQLGEREDAVLHVSIDRPVPRGQLRAVSVPPARSAETVFTNVASTTARTAGSRSVADFTVPRGVPVERIAFSVAGEVAFRRSVAIDALPLGSQPDSPADQFSGEIQRMDLVRSGQRLQVDSETVDAVLLQNQLSPMRVSVAILNGTLPPLTFRDLSLQMRERQLCFTAWPSVQNWRLFYGNSSVAFTTLGQSARSLVQRENPVRALLGPERMAEDFTPLSGGPKASSPHRLLFASLLFLSLLALLVTMFLRTMRIPHRRR